MAVCWPPKSDWLPSVNGRRRRHHLDDDDGHYSTGTDEIVCVCVCARVRPMELQLD